MGVCRFFQQGSCRFGTKCHHEHFDVKQYLKTDIESCINGKMWPFSVYGPFKDKPNIPNFIEDQSFEEVRYQAYESRRQNCFEQFHQQFTKEVHDATNKMKVMLQASPQILDVMIKLYEAPEGTQPAPNNNINPFGLASNNGAQSNSVFGKSAFGSDAGNIFRSAATTTSFATNGNSIFGGAAVGSNNAGTNIFGGATSTNTNIFTQQHQQQPFGQSQAGSFGQQTLGQTQSSIFNQPQLQQQHNPFGQPVALAAAPAAFPSNGCNVFTHTQSTNASPFAPQAVPFAPQPGQEQASGMFGQTVSSAVVSSNGNIFAQAAATQQPPNGFFGQAGAGFQQQQQMQSDTTQQLQMIQQQQQQLQPTPIDNASLYSRLEDLTPEEIAAFKADQFSPGLVPFKPPPRELC